MQRMEPVVTNSNPLSHLSIGAQIPPAIRRRPCRRHSSSMRHMHALKTWSQNWSNRGNIFNAISCLSYFPLNFSRGYGVTYNPRATAALYVGLATVNLVSASCYMIEVSCSGVPVWPDLVAPATGLASAILYQITGVMYMYEASPALLVFVLWAEFFASLFYFFDSFFYLMLWYRFQFEEGAVKPSLRRRLATTHTHNSEVPGGLRPSPTVQRVNGATGPVTSAAIRSRVIGELRQHFWTLAFQARGVTC